MKIDTAVKVRRTSRRNARHSARHGFVWLFFFFKTYVFKTQHISAVRRLKHDHTSAQHSLTDLLPAFLSIYSNSQAMLLQVSQSLPCRAGQHQHAQNYQAHIEDMTSNTAGLHSPRVWIMLTAFSLFFLLPLILFSWCTLIHLSQARSHSVTHCHKCHQRLRRHVHVGMYVSSRVKPGFVTLTQKT